MMLEHEVNEKGSALYTHFIEVIEDRPASNRVVVVALPPDSGDVQMLIDLFFLEIRYFPLKRGARI
jgi:hypothetical protein